MISSTNQVFNDSRKTITFRESGRPSEYRASNPEEKHVIGYLIDGGLIDDQLAEKCDYGLELDNEKKLYLIELKGSDLRKACSQIHSTIKILGSKISGYIVNGRIVLSRTPSPDVLSNEYKCLSKKIRELNGTLEQRTKIFPEAV